jgi:cold-inducible RNA-binding protein
MEASQPGERGSGVTTARLYVRNLSFNTAEEELAELLGRAGDVVSCKVIMERFTGRSKGFAFVEMGSPEEASRAISQFNRKELDGRALTVKEARPREDHTGGGFAGGDRRGGRDRAL